MHRQFRSSVWILAFCLSGLFASHVFAGDSHEIIGRWDNPVSDSAYIRFNNDGTFKEVALLKTTEGTYRFLSKEVMEWRFPGVIYGENIVEIKYRLYGDTLELKLLGNWVKYSRSK
jgi:hypothetical protein